MKRLAIVIAVFLLASCAHQSDSAMGYSSSGTSANQTVTSADGSDVSNRNGAAAGVYIPDAGTFGNAP